MTKEKYEPAKIIGKVDVKKDDKGHSPDDNEPAKSSIEEPLDGTKEGTVNSAASSQTPSDGFQETIPPAGQEQESITDRLHRNAEQERADIAALENGAIPSERASTLPGSAPR